MLLLRAFALCFCFVLCAVLVAVLVDVLVLCLGLCCAFALCINLLSIVCPLPSGGTLSILLSGDLMDIPGRTEGSKKKKERGGQKKREGRQKTNLLLPEGRCSSSQRKLLSC